MRLLQRVQTLSTITRDDNYKLGFLFHKRIPWLWLLRFECPSPQLSYAGTSEIVCISSSWPLLFLPTILLCFLLQPL